MPRKRHPDVVHRWEGNPILTLEDVPFRCSDITNAGAVRVGEEYLLLVTVESLEGTFSIYPARSSDGYHFEVSDRPFLEPCQDAGFAVYEELGVLDARIILLEDSYYVSYNARSRHGFRLGLARTRDFQTAERVALTSEPDTKAGIPFPRKIDGRFARLERPGEGASIWLTYSEDLEYWGRSEVVMTPRGGFWDANRIGLAAPPIETDRGWLILYYGEKDTSAGPLFRLGAAVLDLDNPARVRSRTNIPILSPRETYERIGDVPNLVYSCGAILEPDNVLKIYYGAANSCICVATAALEDLIQTCVESKKEF